MEPVSGSSMDVDTSHCSVPQSIPQLERRMESVDQSVPDCDCGFTHSQGPLANVPLRLRRGGSLASTLYRKTLTDNELRLMNKNMVSLSQ